MKKILAFLVSTLILVSVMAPLALAEDAGFVDGKFTETRTITVALFDRNTDGAIVGDNVYTDFIKEGMLDTYNVNVEFEITPRWTEGEDIATYLAAGTAADVSYSYNGPIDTYFQQDAILDLAPLLEEYAADLTDLTDFLGTNITWKQDPYTGAINAIPARRMNIARINTFVRKDWLDALGLEVPTTTQEFEDMLIAFRDNAELLLGDDADMMVPFAMTEDVGWEANNILYSFVADVDTTDKINYIYGYDDRQFLLPGIKEGVRLLNKWYNEGLILQDFSLYTAGDETVGNLMKAGYVGAFEANWDNPYRNGEESVSYMLQQAQGDDAIFIAIDPFQNDAGLTKKVNYQSNGIYIFFPSTNTEPLASLLYLNWMAKFENRFFLQTGVEGINFEYTEDGTLKAIAAEAGRYKMISSNNGDLTMIINGLDLGDVEKTSAAMALGYANVDPELIKNAYAVALTNGVSYSNISLGTVAAEDGMSEVLKEKRNETLNTSIVASVEDFDAVFDAGMADYLSSGGQAIIDERMEKYTTAFGE